MCISICHRRVSPSRTYFYMNLSPFVFQNVCYCVGGSKITPLSTVLLVNLSTPMFVILHSCTLKMQVSYFTVYSVIVFVSLYCHRLVLNALIVGLQFPKFHVLHWIGAGCILTGTHGMTPYTFPWNSVYDVRV
jgi:hypothetical protein